MKPHFQLSCDTDYFCTLSQNLEKAALWLQGYESACKTDLDFDAFQVYNLASILKTATSGEDQKNEKTKL